MKLIRIIYIFSGLYILFSAKITIPKYDQILSEKTFSEIGLTNLSNPIHFIFGFIFLTSSTHIIALFFPI